MDWDKKAKILITCGKGLGPYLSKEVQDLGFSSNSSHETGVEIEATLADTMKLNLGLRTAYNVLYLLSDFSCTGPDTLYKQAYVVPWEEIIPVDEYISIVSRVDNPTIKNSMFASQKLKDAIVDKMKKCLGKRPDAGPERVNVVINLYWKNDRAWIYLNTSGSKLADRGYRRIPMTAPMQESLAAGVVLATGYEGNEPFVNPMCGSGTIAIEAALIALNRAPGLLRGNFGFMHVRGFNERTLKTLRSEISKRSKRQPGAKIMASDIDPRAVEAAKKNAKTAGVDHLIEFEVKDFKNIEMPSGPGIVVFNPAYGERLGRGDSLFLLYESLGDFLKQKCQGYTGYIFTGNPELAKSIGLRSSQRTPFFNAEIECRLLKYEIYAGSK